MAGVPHKKQGYEEGSLDQYLRDISVFPLISREDEVRLAQRIRTPRATGVMEAPRSEPRVPLAPAFAWLCFAHLMALTAWIAVPGMSGTGLGPPLQQLAALFSRTG